MKKIMTGFSTILLLFLFNTVFSQTSISNNSLKVEDTLAYKILESREIETNKELEHLLENYTENSSVVLSKRFELGLIMVERVNLLAIELNKIQKLNMKYGNLLVNKIALTVEIRNLLENYTPRHPKVTKKLSELSITQNKSLTFLE